MRKRREYPPIVKVTEEQKNSRVLVMRPGTELFVTPVVNAKLNAYCPKCKYFGDHEIKDFFQMGFLGEQYIVGKVVKCPVCEYEFFLGVCDLARDFGPYSTKEVLRDGINLLVKGEEVEENR